MNNFLGTRCCAPYCPQQCPTRPTCNATVTVGSTTTLEPGSPAYVTNTGTLQNAILNFGIPRGATGATGATGPQGPAGEDGADGEAATITIGATTTLPAGSTATVTNTGTLQNAILNFGIPRGAAGAQGVQGPAGPQGETGATGPQGPSGVNGADGEAATIVIGTVTALEPGETPTIVNSGTATNAILDFGIPAVDEGPAVENLEATATLAIVIAKINELLAALRTAGVIEE